MSSFMDERNAVKDEVQAERYLTFALGAEVFGINIKNVTEIIGIQPITRLPEVPSYIKGIINLRGKVIPVIDMRIKFGKEVIEYNDRTCIIVIDVQELAVGLIVDNVTEVMSIHLDNIVPPPVHNNMNVQNQYISGIGKVGNEVKLLLDCEKLLGDEDILQENRDGTGRTLGE